MSSEGTECPPEVDVLESFFAVLQHCNCKAIDLIITIHQLHHYTNLETLQQVKQPTKQIKDKTIFMTICATKVYVV